MTHEVPVIGLLARLVVRLAAFLVPRDLRARWREEWLGEIEAKVGSSKLEVGSSAKLLRRILGAPWDAVAARRTSLRDTGRAIVAGWRTDLRQTLRTLWHAPAHVAMVVVCLGVGTAVSVSVFSAINALLFGEIPGLADRKSLVRLFVGYEGGFGTEGIGRGRTMSAGPLSTSDFETLDAGSGSALTGLAFEGDWQFAVSLDREPVGTTGAFVSGDYFRVLGTTAAMGRLLRPDDDRTDAPAVAVVGYHVWRDRFDAAPDIVGRSILVGDRTFTVVGVAPPRFTGVQPGDIGASPLNYPQLWLPLHHAATWPGVPARDVPWHTVVGRLAPGVSQEDARAAMTIPAGRLAAAFPDTRRGAYFVIRSHGFGPDDSPVQILLIVMLLLSVPLTVLAIGCANVANLQLARATERARELSVRLALGASRSQVIRLLTFEAGLLAAVSAGAGWIAARLILNAGASAFPLPLVLDRHVLAFALALTVGITLLSGLAPAWLTTRRSVSLGLKQTARGGALAHSRLRNGLVVLQMALSLALLVTSGLFVASLRAMRDEVPPAARTTLVVSVDLDELGYSGADTRRLRDEISGRLLANPRVQSVSAERTVGFRYWYPRDSMDVTRHAAGGYVTASWFETVGARLVAGRLLRESDAGMTAVVSERLARELAPDGSAVGQSLYLTDSVIASQSNNAVVLLRPLAGQQASTGASRQTAQIVGVIGDIPRRPGDARPDPVIYLPMPADAPGLFTLRIRTGEPIAVASHVRDVIRSAERRLSGVDVDSAETLFLREIGPLRAMAVSIGGLGAVALLLAAAGLYAVMAYVVSLRRQEIGIRLAIGARPGDVVRLVLRQALGLGVIGSLIGLAIATPIALGLRVAFVGVSPFDPAAMLPPVGVLVVVTLLAATIPARRAARIDPIRALRED